MKPVNEKAAGVSAPTALDCATPPNGNNNTPPRGAAQRGGTSTAATFLGTALRHAREAQAINLRLGPCHRVGREIERARDALDSARWLCDYCGGER